MTLTLPGTIPGLLRRGSPLHDDATVLTSPSPDDVGDLGVMVSRTPESSGDHVYCEWVGDLALDLTDATGRAHAAWWLARRQTGMPCIALWDGTPDGSPGARVCVWRLRWRSVSWPARPASTGSYPYTWRDVPSLADLDPDDPRLLPDGSRWVDAEALRRVCLHVAELAAAGGEE